MYLRFDHLLHWVPDLEAAMTRYAALGFHPVYGGRHTGRGTVNALCHVGLPYVELLAIENREQVAASYLAPQLPWIEENIAAGGGALMFAVSVFDVQGTYLRLRKAGQPIGEVMRGARHRPDGSLLSWRHARLGAGPRWRPFFIEWEQTPGGREADLRERGLVTSPQDGWPLQRLVIEAEDPKLRAAWLTRVLGLDAPGPDDTVPLPGCEIAIVNGPAERIVRVDLEGGPEGSVAGLTFGSR